MSDVPSAQQRRQTYLAKAKEAESLAQHTEDLDARRLMLQIAQSWRLVAASTREPPE